MLLVVVRNAKGAVCAQVPFSGGALTIGRDKERNVVLDSKVVSRHHGSLLTSGGRVLYVDEGSGNGSLVNGEPVTAPVPLTGSSIISIGEYLITLQSAPEAAAPKPSAPSPAPPPVVAKPVTASPASAATPQATVAKPAVRSAPAAPVTPSVLTTAQAAAAPSSPAPAKAELDLEVEPVMTTHTPRKPPPPAPTGLEGFRITLDDAPKPKTKVDEALKLSETMSSLLEQQMKGIRSQRDDYKQTAQYRREQFEQAWRDAIVAIRELKSRVGTDPRVLFYVISRDEQDITVKLMESSERGFCNLVFSRRHPVKETIADGVVWLGETGDEPRPYQDIKIALEDFVRRIASKLA